MKLILFAATAALLLSLTLPDQAHAWGKRGHATVAVVAASLAADKDKSAEFLRHHSFDLGYYANVPDIVWKRPESYEVEWVEHFMDKEIFDRGMKDSKIEKPFTLSRAEFEKTFPDVPARAGRSFWRIRELMERLDGLAAELKKTDLDKEQRQARQVDWLVTAGAIGHYVGDLAQPLHVTENYDGQMTDQKGIHSFFEDAVVNQFAPGDLEFEVFKKASKGQQAFANEISAKSTVEILEMLAAESNKDIAKLLETDKKIGRQDVNKALAAYRKMIIDRMARGSLVLAHLWRQPLGWTYNGEKFYSFEVMPPYIPPADGVTSGPGKTNKK